MRASPSAIAWLPAISRWNSRPAARPACWAAPASARPPCCAGWPACCRTRRDRTPSPTWRSPTCCCPGSRSSTTCCWAIACVAIARRLPQPTCAPAPCSRKSACADRLDDRPARLSGGMRQRAALARTLCEDRPVVLMDEPFAHLDAVTRLELQDLAARLLAGRTAVLVTHDPLEALRVGHQIRVLSGTPFIAGPAIEPAGVGAARSGRSRPARPARAPHCRTAGPRAMRPLITAIGLLLGWEVLVWATGCAVLHPAAALARARGAGRAVRSPASRGRLDRH